jgi:predicted transposase YbfD/YdcC
LGATLSASAGQEGLTQAYGVFQQEAAHHVPDYAPETITTDGWDATRAAWQTLFPGIVWILCFLHEVIKIRDWCRSKPALRQALLDKLWHVYQATSKRHFAQRLRRLLAWVNTRTLPKAIDGRLRRLKGKSRFFQRAFDFPDAYRTSNQVDRPMNYLDRTLYAMQDFHGKWDSAEQSSRAMALLWNFHPFCRKIDQGGDYILALKGNQGSLHQGVKAFFETAEQNQWAGLELSHSDYTEAGHHRIEHRQVCAVPLSQVPTLPNRSQWKGFATVVMVKRARQLWNKTTTEVCFYITSLAADAVLLARAIRCHWSIENSLHWVLDVIFQEDQSRIRNGHGPENIGLLRRLSLNLLKREPSKQSLKQKRYRAAMNNDFLVKILLCHGPD